MMEQLSLIPSILFSFFIFYDYFIIIIAVFVITAHVSITIFVLFSEYIVRYDIHAKYICEYRLRQDFIFFLPQDAFSTIREFFPLYKTFL